MSEIVKLPVVDSIDVLIDFVEKETTSHVMADAHLFLVAAKRPTHRTPIEELKRINTDFGLRIGMLEYNPVACECGSTSTGYDFVRAGVQTHGAAFLRSQELEGFMLRIGPEPLNVACSKCGRRLQGEEYIDHHMCSPMPRVCFAYGCCRPVSELRHIQAMFRMGGVPELRAKS